MIHLRPRQQAGVEAIRAAFRRHRRVLYVAPTGFGKTVLFSYIARSMIESNKRVTILVHRAELLDQVCRTLDQFGVTFGVIAAGYPASSARVQVASVFTLINRIRNYPKPDLVIVDEAHHATAGSWGRVFAHWQGVFVLGVTATPCRMDGKCLSGSFDEFVQGPTPRELIEADELSRYVMFAPPTAIGKMRMRCGDFMQEDLEREMDKPKLIGDAVEHYTRLARGKRAVAFCVSLAHAANTERAFNMAGYRAARIDGEMERAERRQLVDSFSRGKIDVLTSCNLISEGFDVPAIECGIMMRPTHSLSLYMQQAGRALRTFPGKDRAILFDHAGNSGRFGLPDQDRAWSLEDETTGRKKATPSAPSLRLCGKCYASSRAGTRVCPECGWAWPVEDREIKQVEGELFEVPDAVRDKVRAHEASVARAREQGMATTFEELKALARERGYKAGWVKTIMRARGGVR